MGIEGKGVLARGGEFGSGENTEMKSEEMMDEESSGDGKRERGRQA